MLLVQGHGQEGPCLCCAVRGLPKDKDQYGEAWRLVETYPHGLLTVDRHSHGLLGRSAYSQRVYLDTSCC